MFLYLHLIFDKEKINWVRVRAQWLRHFTVHAAEPSSIPGTEFISQNQSIWGPKSPENNPREIIHNIIYAGKI